jgi:hypothetical protein
VDRKVLLLVGVLVIVAAGAFVYFDPMDLDLLGLKPEPAVVKAVVPVHPAAPVARPAAKPKPAVAAAPHPAPAAVSAPVPPVAAMPAAAPKAEEPAAAEPAMAPIPVTPPAMKSSKTAKAGSVPAVDKPVRPKNLDLRHCLELKTDAAIAKCAGE